MRPIRSRRRIAALVIVYLELPSAAASAMPINHLRDIPAVAASPAFKRWWWWFQQRATPAGGIPIDTSVRAARQISASRAYALTGQPRRWVSIGPAPIEGRPDFAYGLNRPVSGRVQAVAVDPRNDSHWIIGAAQGGVWETTDAGATWIPKTDAAASLAIGAVAFSESDPRIIFAGTGEAWFTVTAYPGVGLLKSRDGGVTWDLLGASTFTNTSFSDLKVDPGNPDILVAATARGFAGRNGEFPPFAEMGVFTSTDGGSTWQQRLRGEGTDLEVDPRYFANQYAALGDIFCAPGTNGLYRSTDTGSNWQRIGGPWEAQPARVGRIELAIAPSDPNVMYISIQDAFTYPNVCTAGGTEGGLLGLWKTTNAWAAQPTWQSISVTATDDGSGTEGYCGWRSHCAQNCADYSCWAQQEIAVDPTRPDVLFAGGVAFWKYDGHVWTLLDKARGSPNAFHIDQHKFVFAGNRLIIANDGGVYSSTDGGDTWSDHNTTLAITQFYYGALHPTDARIALGAGQDNGTALWTGARAWDIIQTGDGSSSAFATSQPDTHWAVSAQQLDIYRTTDGGTTLTWARGNLDTSGALFIAPLERCPADENVFIAATDKLWRTDDFFRSAPAAPSWRVNSSSVGLSISALAFAPSDATCQTYAFGTGSFGHGGQIYLTRNGGDAAAGWRDLDPQRTLPQRYVTDLAFDLRDANTLYATFSGFDVTGPSGHVFKTANAGAAVPTWRSVSPPVDLPHNTITIDPSTPETIYVGTDFGVWRSTDAGEYWEHMGMETGLPNLAVFDLQVNPATARLLAFTNGRGAFALSDTGCAGDCNQDGAVTIDELILGVSIALGDRPLTACGSFDRNGDGELTVDELIVGVSSALNGC